MYSLGQHVHYQIMVYGIEEAFNISFDHDMTLS